MPSCWAFSFIWATKASSLPDTASASTTAASLALIITVALMRSSTDMASPSSSQISEPPMEAAWAEAARVWSRDSWPLSRASNTRQSVITLVMEAQERTAWGSFSKSTRPVEASISTAEGAVSSRPSARAGRAGSSRAAATARESRENRSFFIGNHPF